jgi:uncharacterized protein YukE
LAFEGIDIDAAERLAAQLGQHAQTLDAISAQMTRVAEELARSWRGPAAATFQEDWESRHRAVLASARHALSDMREHLRANIADQQRASAAGTAGASAGAILSGGLTLAAGLGQALGGAWRKVDDIDGYVSAVETPLDKITEIAGNDDVTGRYGSRWTAFKNALGDPQFMHYKQSPILHALHDSPRVQQASEILGKAHVPQVLDKVGTASNVVNDIGMTVDAGKGINEAAHGHYGAAAGDAADVAAAGLKSSKNPVLYLAGVDVALIHEDVDLAGQVDWKQGLPNPFSGSNFADDYLPTFKSLPGQMVGPLAKAFF